MKQLIIGIWASAMLLVSSAAMGLDLRLSQNDLNQMVQMAFPQSRQYQGIDMRFSEPVVTLNAQNAVNVMVTIQGQNQGQSATVRAGLQGELDYQPQTGTLNILRPQLTDLDVLKQPEGDHSQLIETLQSMKNQPAPLILLINFAQLDLPMLGDRPPKNIQIKNQQLMVTF